MSTKPFLGKTGGAGGEKEGSSKKKRGRMEAVGEKMRLSVRTKETL